MKKIFGLILLIVPVFFISCLMEEDDGGARGTVSGTITNNGGYANLKMGFFPTFGANEGLDYSYSYGYLYFDDIDDDSAVAVTPAVFQDVVAGSYSFDLPTDPMDNTGEAGYEYLLAVWVDADDDDILDLIDTYPFSASEAGEFSQLPLKLADGETVPDYIHDFEWLTYEDATGGSLGGDFTGYKFYGGSTTYRMDGEGDTNTGLNFILN